MWAFDFQFDQTAEGKALATGATLSSTSCLVGDRVQRRRALTHRDLDRPVAFLGGAELAPLLDLLPQTPSLADVIARWDAMLPAGRAEAIAGWLQARGMLARAGWVIASK